MSEAQKEAREALDQIIRDADGYWPVARDAILALMDEASRAPQPTEDDQREPVVVVQAALDAKRLRQIAEWMSGEGLKQTAAWLTRIAIRHEHLAAGFRRAPAEPAVTEPVPVTIAARRAGKTQALIENLLAQANEHGIHVKVEYDNAVTDAQVLVALNAWYAKEREQNGWPIGSNATELADCSPQAQDRMRAALRAAFAVREEGQGHD